MTVDYDSLVRRVLSGIAPDVDVAAIDAGEDIREAADIDSVDFLSFVSAIYEETGIDIPERYFAAIRTIAGCEQYLAARAAS